MIKALQVYRTYYPDPPGGLQEAVRQIAISTAKHGVESRIFTLSPTPFPASLHYPEGEVVRAKSWMAPASCDIGGVSAFTRFSRLSADSDVIHYQFPWPFADLLHVATRPAAPAIMTYQSDVVRQKMLGKIYAPLMWRMLRSMKVIVASSPSYAQTSPVLSHALIRDKVRVIPNGIDEETYPTKTDDSIFQKLNIPSGEPYFLFIGVLRYYKGLHTLVEAAKDIECRIVIAGAGPEEIVLKKQADVCGAKNIVFAGRVSEEEKKSLLTYCRGLVLPSHLRSEAFGMVLVEASIYSKPMITCEIGTGTSYVNLDGQSGFVVPPEKPAELANVMNSLLRDDALSNKMGIFARQRYEQSFSGDALGKAYANLYNEVLMQM